MAEVIIFQTPLTLGRKVRILRISHGWTQDDLALEANVPQGRVSALERDLPVYPSAKQRVLKVLGLNSESDSEEADHE